LAKKPSRSRRYKGLEFFLAPTTGQKLLFISKNCIKHFINSQEKIFFSKKEFTLFWFFRVKCGNENIRHGGYWLLVIDYYYSPITNHQSLLYHTQVGRTSFFWGRP